MKRCFGYIRVSTERQAEIKASLIEQRDVIARYAEQTNLQIVEWFEEVQTAAKRGRSDFAKIVKRLHAGEADGLIIHKIDRSSRNLHDWADIGDLVDAGISVYVAHEKLELSSRGRRLMADIQAVVATDFIRNLREEVKKGISGALKQGLLPSCAPVGYLNHGRAKLKTICPIQGPLVRLAFELYATGRYTLEALLAELRTRGLRTPRGSHLSLNGLSRLLRNRFYVGLIVWNGGTQVHRGGHERLIPAHLFARVQQLLHGRMRHKIERNDFRYRRLFRCQTCKRSLTGEVQKGHIYYRCHGKECRGTCVREETIEQAVQGLYERIAMTKAQLGLIRAYLTAFTEEGDTASDDHGQLQLAAVKDRHDRLVDAYVDGNLDQAAFAARKERLLIEQAQLQERLAASVDNGVIAERAAVMFELAGSALLSHERANDAERRQLLQMLTSNRFIAGKDVAVELRFPYAEFFRGDDFTSSAPTRGILRTIEPRGKRRSKIGARIPRSLRHGFQRLFDWLKQHPNACSNVVEHEASDQS